MKICMYSIDRVFDKGTGGVRRFCELMNALKLGGNDLYLYSYDETQLIRNKGVKGRSLLNSKISNGKTMIGIKSAFLNKDIFEEIKQENFDRVVVFDVRAAISLVLNNVKNINLFLRQDVFLYKTIQLEDSNAGFIKKLLTLQVTKLVESVCLKSADKVVIQCKFDLEGLLNRHFFYRKRILQKAIIQINNINPSWITDGATIEKKSKKYDLIFIGNFKDFRKGHQFLLPALKELTDEGTVLRVAIVGDGKHLEECKQTYRKYDNIEFLGRLSNPIPILEESKLLIVPSLVDSCPNTVLEGLYYRVPVIGSNRSGIPEILNDSDWLFELNIDEIKKKIVTSIDPILNKKICDDQKLRRDELLFDWGSVMAEIVIK